MINDFYIDEECYQVNYSYIPADGDGVITPKTGDKYEINWVKQYGQNVNTTEVWDNIQEQLDEILE